MRREQGYVRCHEQRKTAECESPVDECVVWLAFQKRTDITGPQLIADYDHSVS
jgi:hypothetical protein